MKPTPILTTLLLAPLAAFLCLASSVSAEDRKPVLIEAKRIWDKAQYNSFTDLTRFRDQWFCCFREGFSHTADIGKVRVLRSPDGVAWTSAALIEEDGIDLRDPKFSIKPDGQTVTHLDVPGRPNEATVRIRPDGEMFAMVRRERGDYFGWIGSSHPPYREWSWHETEHRFGGPNFIVLPYSSLIAAGRSYRQPYSTVIASMDREHYDIALTLPSGGTDTGYPGMVWHNDELWVSYYSAHEDKAGNPPPNRHVELPTAIYIARIRFKK